jgi:sugar lactone lactonase YvrE
MKQRSSRRSVAAIAVTAAAAAIVTPLAIAPPAAAAVTQAYFTADGGAVQHFVVPSAVTQIFVSAIGGSGGSGASRDSNTGGSGGAAGSVSAALPVTPGQTLSVYIGNAGAVATSDSPGGGGTASGLAVGGAVVSGGAGGTGDQAVLGAGGGGGGASVVTAGSTPLLAAGGGGGGGGANATAAGGAGGTGGNPAGNGQSGAGLVPGSGGIGAKPGLGVSGQGGQNRFDIAGAGGGGGAGWNIPGGQTGGGAGGISSLDPNRYGNGGGGGGGAGASSAEAGATSVHFATARGFGDGTVFISWDQPATYTLLFGDGFSQAGQPATFFAGPLAVNNVPGAPAFTGTLSFFDSGSLLGTVPVGPTGGAMYTTSTLAPGMHSISASYNGDGVYAGSTGGPLSWEVDAPFTFTSPAKVAGVVGAPLSFTVRTTGFPPPLLIAQGKLDGLTFTDHGDGTGILAGTPLAAGTFAITLSAAGIVEPVVAQAFTLTVSVQSLAITTGSLPAAFTGQAYSQTFAARGGVPPYTWSVSGGQLPKGITLNAKTGVLSGTPTSSGTSTFTLKATDSSSPTHRTATKAFTLTTNGIVPAVYATNGANDSVTSYPLATGNLAPSTRLAGIAQGLNGPGGVAVNDAGRVFVANSGSNAITEYDRGANTPTATISGANTGLSGPAGLTLDSSGRLYVANRPANTVSVFAAGATGNVAPLFTISGADTGLSSPAAVAVDSQGRLWVANASANSITAYGVGANGDSKPVARIFGSATGLNEPQALAVDANGNLLAANTFGESVTSYAISFIGIATSPNVAPIRTISGSSTGLSFPDGIDVDSSGRIYVANQFDNDITTYQANASGNVAPVATIAGGSTGLASPGAIAVTPPLSVLTMSLPAARVGHAYGATVRAGQGTSPYTWTLGHGSLPAGLWLGRDGTIAGTPHRSGRWTFTLRVTDSSHPRLVATRSFTLTVAGR